MACKTCTFHNTIALHNSDSPADIHRRPGNRKGRHPNDPSAASPFTPTVFCRVIGSYSCQPRLYLPYEIVSHYTPKTGFVKSQC